MATLTTKSFYVVVYYIPVYTILIRDKTRTTFISGSDEAQVFSSALSNRFPGAVRSLIFISTLSGLSTPRSSSSSPSSTTVSESHSKGDGLAMTFGFTPTFPSFHSALSLVEESKLGAGMWNETASLKDSLYFKCS